MKQKVKKKLFFLLVSLLAVMSLFLSTHKNLLNVDNKIHADAGLLLKVEKNKIVANEDLVIQLTDVSETVDMNPVSLKVPPEFSYNEEKTNQLNNGTENGRINFKDEEQSMQIFWKEQGSKKNEIKLVFTVKEPSVYKFYASKRIGEIEEQSNEAMVEVIGNQQNSNLKEKIIVEHPSSLSKAAEVQEYEGEVSTWSEFVDAIKDPNSSEINLVSDLKRPATTAINNPGELKKEFTINGNGHTIDFGSGGTTRNGILLGVAAQPIRFILNDVVFIKTTNPTVPILNSVTGATGLGKNWSIEFNNVTTPITNTSGLVGAKNADIFFGGISNLNLTGATTHLDIKNLVFKPNSQYVSYSNGTSTNAAIIVNDGTIKTEANAKVEITNSGTKGIVLGGSTDSAITSSGIYGSVTDFSMDEKSSMKINANIYAYRTNVKNSFSMTGGANFEAIGSLATTVALAQDFSDNVGLPATINLSGQGTIFKVSTESKQTANYGAAMRVQGDGSVFNISDGAEFIGHSEFGTALQIQSLGSFFNVSSGAKLNLTQEGDNGYALGATLRFRIRGTQTFNVTDDAEVNIIKNSGATPAIRMYGVDNSINVMSGAKVKVHTIGNGVPSDGAGDTGNKAIYYTDNGAIFNLEGENSEVDIQADSGPAIISTGTSSITAGPNTVFKVRGKTGTASAGIFKTNTASIIVDNPLFYDFRNDRKGGGNIFNIPAGSIFKSTNSDLSVWKDGVNLDSDPTKNWALFNYELTGANFVTINDTNVPDEFNTGLDSYGSIGSTAYSRMSGNNATPIVDELRIPTNADKSVFGHVKIPIGQDGGRDAWTNEAYVVIKQTKIDGTSTEFTGDTIGIRDERSGLSVYGESERAGLFKIDLPNNTFLESSDKLEVVSAWRGSADAESPRVHQSLPEDLVAPSRVVQDLTPPLPAVIKNRNDINNTTKFYEGTGEVGALVTLLLNDEALVDDNGEIVKTTIDENGEWMIEIPRNFNGGDEVKVRLTDHSGHPNLEPTEVQLPSLDGMIGNINPKENYLFHDAIFEAATKIVIREIDPKVEFQQMVLNPLTNQPINKIVNGQQVKYRMTITNLIEHSSVVNLIIEDVLDNSLETVSNGAVFNKNAEIVGEVELVDGVVKATLNKGLLFSDVFTIEFETTVKKGVPLGTIISNRAYLSGETGNKDPVAATSNTTEIRVVEGVLQLEYASADLSFGKQKISSKQQFYLPESALNFKVNDTRVNQNNWNLTAKLVDSGLTGSTDGSRELPQSLIFRNIKGDIILNSNEKGIPVAGKEAKEGVTEFGWTPDDTEGLRLKINPGEAASQEYSWKIEWSLVDAP